MDDNVIKPKHYADREHEPIDVMKDWLEINTELNAWQGLLVGQVLKYLSRAGLKDDLQQDLEKAHFYMTMLVGKDPREYRETDVEDVPNILDVAFPIPTFEELENKVFHWAFDKGLDEGDPRIQLNKVFEEVGELAEAINKDREYGVIEDAIGDTVITLIILSLQLDIDLVSSLDKAYEEIKDRSGEMVNGQFVKKEDL